MITIVFKEKQDRRTFGAVYRIWFGKKYYIGRARDIFLRVKQHQYLLNKAMAEVIEIDNHYYKHVLAHLGANIKIKKGVVEILIVSNKDKDLVKGEQKWFNETMSDPNCLNLGRISAPYYSERKKVLSVKQKRAALLETIKKLSK